MTTPLPLTNAEALELVALLDELDKDIQEQIQLSLPASDMLIEGSAFKNLVDKEIHLRDQLQEFDQTIQDGLRFIIANPCWTTVQFKEQFTESPSILLIH